MTGKKLREKKSNILLAANVQIEAEGNTELVLFCKGPGIKGRWSKMSVV